MWHSSSSCLCVCPDASRRDLPFVPPIRHEGRLQSIVARSKARPSRQAPRTRECGDNSASTLPHPDCRARNPNARRPDRRVRNPDARRPACRARDPCPRACRRGRSLAGRVRGEAGRAVPGAVRARRATTAEASRPGRHPAARARRLHAQVALDLPAAAHHEHRLPEGARQRAAPRRPRRPGGGRGGRRTSRGCRRRTGAAPCAPRCAPCRRTRRAAQGVRRGPASARGRCQCAERTRGAAARLRDDDADASELLRAQGPCPKPASMPRWRRRGRSASSAPRRHAPDRPDARPEGREPRHAQRRPPQRHPAPKPQR